MWWGDPRGRGALQESQQRETESGHHMLVGYGKGGGGGTSSLSTFKYHRGYCSIIFFLKRNPCFAGVA